MIKNLLDHIVFKETMNSHEVWDFLKFEIHVVVTR